MSRGGRDFYRTQIAQAGALKMLFEPFARQVRDLFERPGFFEKMRGAGDDLESLFATELRQRLLIEFDNDVVVAADQEQRGGFDMRKGIAG